MDTSDRAGFDRYHRTVNYATDRYHREREMIKWALDAGKITNAQAIVRFDNAEAELTRVAREARREYEATGGDLCDGRRYNPVTGRTERVA